MPNSASASKRLRQSKVRRLRNRSQRSALRTQVKKVRQALKAEEMETCDAEFRKAVKKLDQAAAKGLIHANKAARVKSRLNKAIKAVKTAG